MRSIVLAALMALSATPAAAQTVSIKSAEALSDTFKAMGYRPEKIDSSGAVPAFDVEIGGLTTTVKLHGCTKNRNCKYMSLVSAYNDVIEPPASWLQKMNDDFDLLKVGVNNRRELYLFSAFVVEGLPRAEFKRILDFWDADTRGIADEAKDAKLVKAKTTAETK